ncbi:MAG: T9SS type A sorting domain-containing protein [Bacteroidales bacterium]|nr:T9SS type A sorting domain-containing protein [Bacteroidales bacterium]
MIFDITRTVGAGAVPSISDQGTLFVIGNYVGYATAYEYNETDDVYEQKWQYLFDGGANADWVNSIAVSGDGSTIALGSLRFLENSEYNSEVVVLDSESNLPLWVYQTNYDLLSALDISQNGSMIAAASYGPINDNDDDFWLFERNSNEAVFAFNCQGSPYDIDLANNATKCIVGGKAIHARISGNGGKLYYFNINQPISISGIVSDISTNNPLEGAVITLGSAYSETSNAFGFYNIEDVETGNYSLTCELAGYEIFTTEIELEESEVINIELELISGIDQTISSPYNLSTNNYPNPFRTNTTIRYQLPLSINVCIDIFDIQGKKIRSLLNEHQEQGSHTVVWDGKNEIGTEVKKGVYYYNITADKFFSSSKMIFIK